jgi:glycosyltransferase involved in cell wall biosynthesis
MPAVSVLVPCYNSARFIAATLGSLQSQTFSDWECIVVDDGSSDDSARVVRSLAARDVRIRLLQQPNTGVSRARNVAYAASHPDSRYLLFLDSDDCLEADMLELLVSYLEQREDVCLAYCAFTCIGENDELIPANDPRLPNFTASRFVPSRLGIKALPPSIAETPFTSIYAAWAGLLPSNSLLRRSVYATTPGWDEAFGQLAEDTDLFLQMALRGSVHYVPRALLRYRRHGNQATADRARILQQDLKLFHKWAHLALTGRQRAKVQAARSFRVTRLEPYWWLEFAACHLKSGHLAEGMKCILRAGRQYGLGLRTLRSTH